MRVSLGGETATLDVPDTLQLSVLEPFYAEFSIPPRQHPELAGVTFAAFLRVRGSCRRQCVASATKRHV